MSRPREVIDSYMEEVLFKLVSQSIRNMPAEDAADAAKKLRAFEDFNRDSAACKKRITIDSMTALLQIANVTVVDLYQAAGVCVNWPNAESREFYRQLSKRTPSEKMQIRHIIEELSPQFWVNPPLELSTPTKRMLYVIQHKYPRSNNIRAGVLEYLGDEVLKAWNDHKQYTTVSLLSLPTISEKLKVSLHWLLGLGSKATVLAADSISEDCITGYLFLNHYGQATIDMLLEDFESR